MTYAYDEIYLDDAMKNLGEAFDYSATVLNIPMDEFLDMFIISGVAEQFQRGVPKFVSGLSGTELALEVLNILSNQRLQRNMFLCSFHVLNLLH